MLVDVRRKRKAADEPLDPSLAKQILPLRLVIAAVAGLTLVALLLSLLLLSLLLTWLSLGPTLPLGGDGLLFAPLGSATSSRSSETWYTGDHV